MKNKIKNLEQRLKEGIEVTMTLSENDSEISGRYNLHLGHVYRVGIGGSNPLIKLTYDGIMKEITIFADQKGFAIRRLVLEEGLKSSSSFPEKKPFQREEFYGKELSNAQFARIIDEEGFYEVRDEICKKQK